MDRIPPVGSSDFADWVNGDRSAGIKGSFPPHEAWTAVMEELAYALEQFGFTLDAGDLTQVHELFRLLGKPSASDPPVPPNLPQVVALADGTQSLPNGTVTNLAFQTTERNNFVNGSWDGTVFTVGAGEGGLYAINGGLRVNGTGAGLGVYIKKNGVVRGNFTLGGTGAANHANTIPTWVYVAAGDTLQVAGFQSTGGANNVVANETFATFTQVSV